MATNRRIVLASRPAGAVTVDNFRLETVPLPALEEGQLLVRNRWLSLDPYMRGRMNEGRSYAEAQALNETMVGGTAGEVVQSRHPGFAAGDQVVGYLGWQEYGVSDGRQLMKVDTAHVPLSAYLGAVGMPGVTAWYGLNRIIEPKAGETVVVSAASGAVGSVVGQLAKLSSCRAVGIAGGEEKCRYVVEELRFDACIDYKREDVGKALKAAAPDGVDGYFENVGGEIMEAVLPRMNAFGRIALCGLIAGYDGEPIPIRNPTWFLVSRLKLQGFIVSEHMQVWPQALKELGGHVGAGRIRYRESVAQGLQSAPEAFIGLLKGRNFGKQLVKLD
ncbi:MAG: zinc-containing alcohol dehydrogenase superfamily protein [Burkholderiaceae bacterium]|jgi:NADPH-dependent curcumin reductase CurA|nr:zinc-containing alcohol dehydrogenase superfamily protein [Burkholderiaceae bacterium]